VQDYRQVRSDLGTILRASGISLVLPPLRGLHRAGRLRADAARGVPRLRARHLGDTGHEVRRATLPVRGPLVDALSGQPADDDLLRLPAYGALWLVTADG
jgi:hypothetical protein